MAATGWKRPFADPIPLPGGRQLVTLEDAGNYVTKIEHSFSSNPCSEAGTIRKNLCCESLQRTAIPGHSRTNYVKRSK